MTDKWKLVTFVLQNHLSELATRVPVSYELHVVKSDNTICKLNAYFDIHCRGLDVCLLFLTKGKVEYCYINANHRIKPDRLVNDWIPLVDFPYINLARLYRELRYAFPELKSIIKQFTYRHKINLEDI